MNLLLSTPFFSYCNFENGKLFWTVYKTWTRHTVCLYTVCWGFPFPTIIFSIREVSPQYPIERKNCGKQEQDGWRAQCPNSKSETWKSGTWGKTHFTFLGFTFKFSIPYKIKHKTLTSFFHVRFYNVFGNCSR